MSHGCAHVHVEIACKFEQMFRYAAYSVVLCGDPHDKSRRRAGQGMRPAGAPVLTLSITLLSSILLADINIFVYFDYNDEANIFL